MSGNNPPSKAEAAIVEGILLRERQDLERVEDIQWWSLGAQGVISVEALGLVSRNMDYWR